MKLNILKRIFNFKKVLNSKNKDKKINLNSWESDYLSLKEDWNNIGQDIEKAIKNNSYSTHFRRMDS